MSTNKPRVILVVDDSPSDALLLSRALTKSGHSTLVAHHGKEAVRIAREKKPDIILLDMTMPDVDGVTTCRELKKHPDTEQIPVIFITAHTGTDHILAAFAAGGADYVTKPIRVDEILARLSVQMRLRDAERELMERNRQLEVLAGELATTNEVLERQSRLDGLTNLLNRRAWNEASEIEHERSLRYSRPYCVLMLDVDYFKSYNDTLGHPEGDRCLQEIAGALAKTCRNTDIVARYGGEEFVVLATDTTVEAGTRLAERIREGVWRLSIRHPASPAGRVTVSVGVAGRGDGPLQDTLQNADACLYRAKNGGRNLVYSRVTSITPLAPSGEGAPALNSTPAPLPPVDSRPMILVVEDNRENRSVYRRLLTKEGFSISEVENGKEALEKVEQSVPDLIIMDVMMPVMDGIECTRLLKANPETSDVPIIIASARTDARDIMAGLDAGAEEYLVKPIRTEELIVRVRSMVRLSNERRALLRSYELRAEQIRFLTMLVDYCRTVGAASTPEEVYDCLLDTVGALTCARCLFVMAPGPNGPPMTLLRALGLDQPEVRDSAIAKGMAMVEQVFETREAVVVNGAGSSASPGANTSSDPFLSVPLLVSTSNDSTRLLGVLNVTDRIGRRPFDVREVEYVELVSGIASSALRTIQNRRARDDARDLIVNALARLAEHRDSDTGRHVERVTQYSCILTERLRESSEFSRIIDDAFLQNLRRAAPLHDIGKVAIPDRILLKPGTLTLDEMEIMQTHVDIGADTLRPIVSMVPDAGSLKMALDIIRGHHEWYDGSGYPQGLKGDAIPLAARIVAVADVFDALTRNRVYKEAMSIQEARNIITSGAGTQFDPAIVRAFVDSLPALVECANQLADPTAATSSSRVVEAPALAAIAQED